MLKLLMVLIIFLGCNSTTKNSLETETTSFQSNENLIVYLSRTNNTKVVAEIIQQKVGGDLVELELINPYPKDYEEIVQQVVKENESGFLPPLKTEVDISKYEIIFIGFPTWGMQMPPPIKSFLAEYDLSGKTVIPFNTNAGYGAGSGFRQVEELCQNCTILDGFSVEGGHEKVGVFLAIKDERKNEVERQLEKWLQKLKLIRE